MHAWFIAHASADKAWARQVAAGLDPYGGAFLDEVSISSGQAWDQALMDALYAARTVVILLAPGWEAAWYLREEIQRAIALHRRGEVSLVIVHRDGIPADGRAIPYGLYLVNALDGRRADLVDTIRGHAGGRGAGAPTPPPASSTVLHAAGCGLLDPQLDRLAQLDLDAPVHDFRRGTRSDYALDLLLWATQQGRRDELERHLRRLNPAAFR